MQTWLLRYFCWLSWSRIFEITTVLCCVFGVGWGGADWVGDKVSVFLVNSGQICYFNKILKLTFSFKGWLSASHCCIVQKNIGEFNFKSPENNPLGIICNLMNGYGKHLYATWADSLHMTWTAVGRSLQILPRVKIIVCPSQATQTRCLKKKKKKSAICFHLWD